MAKNKTRETDANVEAFIESFANTEQKKQDSFELIKLMQNITGFEPKMWGPSIIGFGRYHYKYASGHEGDAPLVGFSPRKSAISLYVFTGKEDHEYLLDNLGKFRKGKACIYINKLADINQAALENLINETIRFLQATYGE
ncbi:DUF1801 domain-containing protein [Membranicola marinus]|uniref:DUF1801 domain-containing protein n=1 Tax=Membranihabitans marinus TaxID=1227546 RepID=A0A953HRW3_9BACT|nr:DUF1801 domain-containing protein [Membranihabitans marinus]MBY5959798.1 DUF1801 domain-containing protein [Membranihabitans marinus]